MADQALWKPDEARKASSAMGRFQEFVSAQTGLSFSGYKDLHSFSVRDIQVFWDLAAKFLDLRWHHRAETVYQPGPESQMLGGQWFPGSTLSWTENLLPQRHDQATKIISIIEGREQPIIYTGAQLYEAVARCAAYFRSLGLRSGDRVAAVVPNTGEAIIAMLAATALGAVWSSCSPDFGIAGIVDRFAQIEPSLLIMTRSYVYGGKTFDCRDAAAAVLEQLPSVRGALMIDPLEQGAIASPWVDWKTALASIEAGAVDTFTCLATSFDHPLYILYSSGTTGKPKCIVHSVGGTLLQHKKELMLHSDLGPGQRLLYFTTCGWMMWNWMVSGLSVGASLVLFEGSIAREDFAVLWRAVDEHEVTCFGTSPKFLAATEKAGLVPKARFPLKKLRTLLSTGSPLMPEQFTWVYESVAADVHLASISGGTDIISCFMLGNPLSPVWAGEIQGPGLGMAVDCWDAEGRALRQHKGELVCTKPFPSMPLGFWKDAGEKYREAYFNFYTHTQVWRHGDFIEINERGGILVYGRSDATLNPGGVRIGTAEIYRQVESLPYVQDSLAVSHDRDGDAEMLLFVRLRDGHTLDAGKTQQIRSLLRTQLSPRHVPAAIFSIQDIPYTRSGKKLEIAVTRILNGQGIDNLAAIANPECLEEYQNLAKNGLRT